MKSYKTFEKYILWPLDILSYVFIVVFLVKTAWFWLAVSVISAFYLGVVGQSLHPLQSTSDLAKGPTTNPKAIIEDSILPDAIKKRIISRACTKIGILLGIIIGLILWKFLGWHWYFVLPAMLVIVIFIGALLKLLFKIV